MAIFANVFDDETMVYVEADCRGEMPCLRLEDAGARLDILCSREVLCRIGAAVHAYMDGGRGRPRTAAAGVGGPDGGVAQCPTGF
jgi:hypothetical protein